MSGNVEVLVGESKGFIISVNQHVTLHGEGAHVAQILNSAIINELIPVSRTIPKGKYKLTLLSTLIELEEAENEVQDS